MGNFSNTINTSKTIREFLTSYKDSHTIKITLPSGSSGTALTQIYNVDVIWDGGNYYIAYTTSNTSTDIVIAALDSVLPISLVTIPSTT